MSQNTSIIIITVCAAVLIFILILLILVKLGILGTRRHSESINSVQVNEGMNIESGMNECVGLNGFGEYRSETIAVGATQARRNCIMEFVNIKTNASYKMAIFKSFVVGRGHKHGETTTSYLKIPDEPSISRDHALLELAGEHIYISDLGSTNHTKLNGIMVQGPMELQSGDIVNLGLGSYYVYINFL